MKRKTLYEKEVEKMENVKMTLETQVIHLESAAQNAATIQAIQTGSQAMRRVQAEMGSLDRVDTLMDDIREGMETAREIEDALSQPLDPLLIDNDDLLEELAELENQDVAAALLDACALVSTTVVSVPAMDDLTLPTVPNTSVLPTVLSRQEEEDLEQLEAEIEGLAAWKNEFVTCRIGISSRRAHWLHLGFCLWHYPLIDVVDENGEKLSLQ